MNFYNEENQGCSFLFYNHLPPENAGKLCLRLFSHPTQYLISFSRCHGGIIAAIAHSGSISSGRTVRWRSRFIFFFQLTLSFWLLQVDELLKQRDSIHASFTVAKMVSYLSNGSTSKVIGDDSKAESPVEDGGSDGKDKSSKKKWFNLNLKGSEKKQRRILMILYCFEGFDWISIIGLSTWAAHLACIDLSCIICLIFYFLFQDFTEVAFSEMVLQVSKSECICMYNLSSYFHKTAPVFLVHVEPEHWL